MSDTISADDALFGQIITLYTDQSRASSQTERYVTEHCRLDDSIGLLLMMLKPNYDAARDQCTQAFGTVATLCDRLVEAVQAHQQACHDSEDERARQLDELGKGLAQIDDLSNRVARLEAGAGGGRGGSSGGGRPSGSMPGLGSLPPAAPVPAVTQQAQTASAALDGSVAVTGSPALTTGSGTTTVDGSAVSTGDGIQIVVGNGSTATISLGGDVAHPEAGHPDASHPDPARTDAGGVAAPRPDPSAPESGASGPWAPVPGPAGPSAPESGPAGAPSAGPGPDPLIALLTDPGTAAQVPAEQQAHDAAAYHRVWADLAAHDPLGRTAQELQASWEAREPITPPATAGPDLGAPVGDPAAVDLRLVTPADLAAASSTPRREMSR